MRICAQCFSDGELKDFIRSNAQEIGVCECCGESGLVVDLKELYDFFYAVSSLYESNIASHLPFVEKVQSDWNIFSSKANAEKIMSFLNQAGVIKLLPSTNIEEIAEISSCAEAWDTLKAEVRNKFRFFSDIHSFNWDSYISSNYILKKGDVLFRSRIIPEGAELLTPKDMSCPPPLKATPGRANPIGIPYLYLCDNECTTFYETRCLYLDRVALGRFLVTRDLNIVDFEAKLNLFYAFSAADNSDSLIESVKQRRVLDLISKEMSKPLRRFDTEIEYIPTQLMCEYCKQIGADGIKFTSSLDPSGCNIVLFNPDDAKCTKVYTKEITSVKIEFRELQ